MAEELKLTNEQRLMQRLSPLQAQYVSLVEMNRAEIEEKVRNEIDDNPALEVKDSSDNDLPLAADNRDEDGDTFNESAEQMQLADYRDEDDIPYYRTNISNSSPDDEQREAVVVAESSIIDFLNDQIAERDLSPRQQAIAKYIIGNIDDNGYLQRSIEEICDDLVFQVGMDVSDNDVKEVLQMVHDLEPAGIAAADLRECLLLQLERRTAEPASLLAYQIIDRYFDEFSKKHFARIMSALNADETLFREA
ncbi:MAG: RNA polymerase sigma-54 factor, partial [Muribaculaceae bacterium]|nr:RNA polymerase sigma-54 factor [Muribaculaceae bacterium]